MPLDGISTVRTSSSDLAGRFATEAHLMDTFTRREDRHSDPSNLHNLPDDKVSQPSDPVEDEMGLLGLGFDANEDQLLRYALASKPEEYFSCDPRHPTHEVL